ncbi:hypothetical protein F383_19961 [Gossypium arboreum]|uniref:Uncharacterized protein n=1 Tax=Gossypium arboreum TaxID=29729 RepID=A0A0B0NMJ4_GOSAR|nr:hypothetical protein F383_19961 [Gossypium arboreum]
MWHLVCKVSHVSDFIISSGSLGMLTMRLSMTLLQDGTCMYLKLMIFNF